MKKLMMAAAIVCAAVQAQALYLSVDSVFSPAWDDIYANGYFIYSDTLSQSAAVAAFSSAGASYEPTIASTAELTEYIYEGVVGEYVDVSRFDEMYFLCFDQDNNSMYVSPVASYNPEGGGSYYFDALETSTAAAKLASDGYKGAGWYYSNATSPIPEPTSGLLMLLGVAGLALKRKRA